jgi:hypothetical protein
MKKFLMVFVLALSVLAGAGRAGATVMVTFDPSTSDITAGSTFTVGIMAAIPVDQGVVGWGFGLVFDDAQVALQDVVAGPLWDLVFAPTSITPLDPLVALFPATSTSPAAGATGSNVLLATLTMLCISPGSSLLDISVADPAVDPSQGFMTAAGDYAAWVSVPATINQTPGGIPEPTSLLLFLAALGGAAWTLRRSSRA